MEQAQPDRPAQLGELIARVYPDLRRMAAARTAGSGCSPSSLAQETVCRLLRLPEPPASEDGVRAVAFRLMEWTLLDRLRADGARRVRENAQGKADPGSLGSDGRMEKLSAALLELAAMDERKAEALTLSALCGMNYQQIAAVTGVTTKTVQRDLAFARAWVAAKIGVPADERPRR